MDAKEIIEEAKAFAEKHLVECCQDLVEWYDGPDGVLRDGKFRELSRIYLKLHPASHISMAENQISHMAIALIARGDK